MLPLFCRSGGRSSKGRRQPDVNCAQEPIPVPPTAGVTEQLQCRAFSVTTEVLRENFHRLGSGRQLANVDSGISIEQLSASKFADNPDLPSSL